MVFASSTTGSGELAPILMIDGATALQDYGIPLEYCDRCPKCQGWIHQLLAYNPTNSYKYLAPCAICGQFIEYKDNTNALTNFSLVKSGKTTPYDTEMREVWERY